MQILHHAQQSGHKFCYTILDIMGKIKIKINKAVKNILMNAFFPLILETIKNPMNNIAIPKLTHPDLELVHINVPEATAEINKHVIL